MNLICSWLRWLCDVPFFTPEPALSSKLKTMIQLSLSRSNDPGSNFFLADSPSMYKPVHLKVLTKYWQHCGNRLFSDPCGADREWGTTIVIGYSAVLWMNLLPVLSNQMFSGCQPHTQFLEGGGNVCQYWDWKARVRDASINCKELVGFFYAWLLTVCLTCRDWTNSMRIPTNFECSVEKLMQQEHEKKVRMVDDTSINPPYPFCD